MSPQTRETSQTFKKPVHNLQTFHEFYSFKYFKLVKILIQLVNKI